MEGIQQFLPMIFIFVAIYFFMIRPQQKKMKQEKTYEASLKVGDRIVTKSGLHGRIAELNELTVVVETMAGKLLMERSAISMDMSQKLQEKK
ncbi:MULTISPECIES: preprotein translocase subunit YajC [Myroides]|jgi:preprotein translocase subunit YajC|uniref:Sec translocon accessory complex subunit YajC n=1 Tax=Myroides odoratus TaxID=256 RepID=A0A9Q6ZBS9_MYROD|nr:preprotein translocase subunit YajC [Myroides odoratus]EHQ43397.1 protein translocase subunit yajC [Myroides odoratus DSM 2801]EKB06063.1 preprotein translocase, YajC subunit [Myroides odoratus CIP 103059]QQU00735.1 preprotein translocase subunit YajC [Myroides odoratus]WQD57026.1 preprotein translocase subunit YajC [Myroides odoratus]STZ30675.1 preprotein translocase subunit YajC [Myroides odoratus]